jgi:hypothetical protein
MSPISVASTLLEDAPFVRALFGGKLEPIGGAEKAVHEHLSVQP